MEYVVEISDMHGDGVANEDFSHLISSLPLPVPNVGDNIYLPSGCGPDSKRSGEFTVVSRLFTYTPKERDIDACVHVQLFCREKDDGKK